jgi:hypothetical protein
MLGMRNIQTERMPHVAKGSAANDAGRPPTRLNSVLCSAVQSLDAFDTDTHESGRWTE